MRVGIVTYHFHYNYGTMLQAFALQKAIEELGYDTEIVDFFQPNKKKKSEVWRIRLSSLSDYIFHPSYGFNSFYKRVIMKKYRSKIENKEKRFRTFYSQNIRLSDKHYSSTQELIDNQPEYDIYVVGSDQTWNPFCGGNPDAFYLNFVSKNKKRISYAPSISVMQLNEAQKRRIKELLMNVQVLSCREESGAVLLRELTGRRVTCVLDPTFLLGKSKWEKYAKESEHPKHYILQYFLGDDKKQRGYVKRLSEIMGVPIVSLPIQAQDLCDKATIKSWAGPSEFLDLINKADLICTDSFHGSALSIIHRKSVFSFFKFKEGEINSENSRITDLYSKFGINNRIITDYSTFPRHEDIKLVYDSNIEEKINNLIERSYEYLINALKGDINDRF